MDGMERKGQKLSTQVFDRVRLLMQGNCVECFWREKAHFMY